MSFPSPEGRVTARDIARRLNVSQATVSRALRNDPRITEAVRKSVRETAEALGYRPDPMLTALTHYRWSKEKKPISAEVAWLNHWPDPKQLRSFKEFDLYWQGASEEAARCGFRLEEFIIGPELSMARLQKILFARNIRGILIPPHGLTELNWGEFEWKNFCVVRFGYTVRTPRAHLVTSDQLSDGLLAFQNMSQLGYERIGLVTIKKIETRFSAGYFLGQMKWRPNLRLPPLLLSEVGDQKAALKSWITANKPDAILTDVRDLAALLKEIGVRVPQDVGLAALSVLDGNVDAGIDQQSYEVGRAAVQMLISLINHNEFGVPEVCRELLIEGKWVNGSMLPGKK